MFYKSLYKHLSYSLFLPLNDPTIKSLIGDLKNRLFIWNKQNQFVNQILLHNKSLKEDIQQVFQPKKISLYKIYLQTFKYSFACFRDYIVNPWITEKYHRNIYLNKLIPDADQQRAAIISLIEQKRMKYDKILMKIEDKKECNLLKESLKNRYKVALYTSEDKETKLNENCMFETDLDVIISTSSIQNGQSIKENVLSIFVQTYIDTTSSIRQFLGRNRNRDSNIVLYVRYGKHLTK